MINAKQSRLQRRIEYNVTRGLGFDSSTKYLEEDSFYRKIIQEEDIKNTNEGLQVHLAEMNYCKDVVRIIEKYKLNKKGFNLIKKVLGVIAISGVEIRNFRLKNKAVRDAVKKHSRKPLSEVYTQAYIENLLGDSIPFFIYTGANRE